jgi:hypothetical protein
LLNPLTSCVQSVQFLCSARFIKGPARPLLLLYMSSPCPALQRVARTPGSNARSAAVRRAWLQSGAGPLSRA